MGPIGRFQALVYLFTEVRHVQLQCFVYILTVRYFNKIALVQIHFCLLLVSVFLMVYRFVVMWLFWLLLRYKMN